MINSIRSFIAARLLTIASRCAFTCQVQRLTSNFCSNDTQNDITSCNTKYHSTDVMNSAGKDDPRPWVLITTTHVLLPRSQEILNQNCRIVLWDDFLGNRETYRERIEGILYIPAARKEMPEELLRSLTNLKVVTTHSVGTNFLDLPLLRSMGLKVGHARGVLDDTCADFTFGLLIAAARRLPECMKMAQGHSGEVRGFAAQKATAPAGVRVSGATLGIVGMGSIGFEVARRAALGFKMKVLYHNRTRRNEEDEREVGATYYQSLDAMLPEVDFLVITASLNGDSKYLIGKEHFRLMKPSAIVINDSRGLIIDQEAMVEALQQGVIRGAALDATTPEPLPKDHPLLHMPNVIVTAHLSSYVAETIEKMMQNCVDNILAGTSGRPLPTEVPY